MHGSSHSTSAFNKTVCLNHCRAGNPRWRTVSWMWQAFHLHCTWPEVLWYFFLSAVFLDFPLLVHTWLSRRDVLSECIVWPKEFVWLIQDNTIVRSKPRDFCCPVVCFNQSVSLSRTLGSCRKHSRWSQAAGPAPAGWQGKGEAAAPVTLLIYSLDSV